MNVHAPEDRAFQGHAALAQPGLADLLGVTAALKMVRRRFVIMAGVALVAAALAFSYSMMGKPKYMASALIMINARQESVVDGGNVLGQLPREGAVIDSEIEILRSPALMSRLVDALNLTQDAEFNWTLGQPSFIQSLLHPIRRTQAPEAAKDDGHVEPWLREAIAGSVASHFNIDRRGNTLVIEIAAWSVNRERAQQLANTYADIYLESQAEARVDSTRRAGEWLSDRLEQLRADVQTKEAAVEEFRSAHGLVSAEGATLTEQQITTIQNSVLQAQADLAEKEARYRQLQTLRASGSSLDTIGDAINSDVIRSLRDREAEIARRQSDLENRYLPTHPDVQAVRSEREDIQRQIQQEIERISANLQNEVDVAHSRLRTLQESLNSVSGVLTGNNSEMVKLRELEREAAASRQVYESYLQREQQITDQERLNTPDARLVNYARMPGQPFSPNFKIALVIALMAGMASGLLAGIGAEVFDRSIHGPDDLEGKVGYPAITSVPEISKKALKLMQPSAQNPPGYLVERPMSGFTEALRVLRTVILHSRFDTPTRVVAVASALPGEGKTTISMSLARVAAMSGQKVLVIDCDLRKRSINEILDSEPETGLLQVLAGETSWRRAIRKDNFTQADILPVAASNFTPLDVFGSEAMRRMLAEVREQYDLVVLDCAPLLAVAETRVVVALADAVVIVAQVGKSSTDAVRVAIDHAVTAGASVVGVALNKVPVEGLARFAYADASYYYESKSYYSAS